MIDARFGPLTIQRLNPGFEVRSEEGRCRAILESIGAVRQSPTHWSLPSDAAPRLKRLARLLGEADIARRARNARLGGLCLVALGLCLPLVLRDVVPPVLALGSASVLVALGGVIGTVGTARRARRAREILTFDLNHVVAPYEPSIRSADDLRRACLSGAN